MQVKRKSAAKIGLFSAVSIIIGAIIGIGIFFKNGGVFVNNNGNPTGIIISWVLTFVIALSTAYAFGEIVTCKTKSKNLGLAGWAEEFVGYRFGRFIKITQPLFYYSVFILVIGIFAAEAIWNIFMKTPGAIDYSVIWIMLTAIVLIIIFFFVNYFSTYFSTKFSQITTLLKFIPLITIGILGITFGILGYGNNIFVNPGYDYLGNPITDTPGAFNIEGILMSIPAILFAFDSFLIVGNLAEDMHEPEKNISISIIVSMVVSAALYLLVTIGQIVIGCGSAYDVILAILPVGSFGCQLLSVILSIFILIAILGVLNALTMAGIRSVQTMHDMKVLAGHNTIEKLSNGKPLLAGVLYSLIMIFFFWIALTIPSCILQTDQIIDGASNIPTLFFFGIYGTVALAGVVNRRTKKVAVRQQKGFAWFAIIGAIGCYLAVGYCVFYQFSFQNIIRATDPYLGWGLFIVRPENLMYWEASIVFWSFGVCFLIIPFVNDLIIKLTVKNYHEPLIWEKLFNSRIKLVN